MSARASNGARTLASLLLVVVRAQIHEIGSDPGEASGVATARATSYSRGSAMKPSSSSA